MFSINEESLSLQNLPIDSLKLPRETELREAPKEQPEANMGCCYKTQFFVGHSFRDVGRKKCHFSLAFCAVFIVVLSTLIVNTIIGKGPILFFDMA